MRRYFFHVHDGQSIWDEDGTELADDKAAKAEAVVLAGGLLADLGSKFWDGENWRLQVVGEDGEQVCALEFSGKASQAVA